MKVKNICSFKATIFYIIVAFVFTLIIHMCIIILFKNQISDILLMINKTLICDKADSNDIQIENDNDDYVLNYPEYGKKYANIIIERIDSNLPVYFGDSLDILKNGIGHSSGSYFPGEGGSIVYMGHNSKNYLRRLGEVQISDNIIVNTFYGEYVYQVYDMKIVEETELNELPIQKENEILMLYTCYPFNNVGYATKRYVVYASLKSNMEI